MTVQFEPDIPSPVYVVQYSMITHRTSHYGGYSDLFSYSSPRSYSYDSTSHEEVGPFETKALAEQAMMSVLSSGTAKGVHITEYASMASYREYKLNKSRALLEASMTMCGYEKDPETGEWKRPEPEPEPVQKRLNRRWFK